MQEIIKTAAGFAAKKLGLKVVKTNLTIMNLTNIDYRAKENKIGTEKYVLPEEPSVSEKTNEPEGNKTEEGTENNIPDERNLIVSEENKDIQSFQADDGNNEPEADKPST
jgi:hypothetical protein